MSYNLNGVISIDAVIVFIVATYLAYRGTKNDNAIIDATETKYLEKRKNPNFYKDEKAFMDLYNCIMEGTK